MIKDVGGHIHTHRQLVSRTHGARRQGMQLTVADRDMSGADKYL